MAKDEQIQYIAESLLEQFIPKDPSENQLSFHFTLPPANSYKVSFEKQKGVWTYLGFEKQNPN